MSQLILGSRELGFQWPTIEPFLFCVHHKDHYPRGNDAMGPAASLAGRRIGSDFEERDGWRMYHGQTIPGFPRHPHRGFETVTLARKGFIDHSDSLGATARFGHGDVQWMTAGKGIVHCEMFPLVNQEQENPTELFQIWLNLPRAQKMVDPHFKMLWSHTIPRMQHRDGGGRKTEVTVIAGALDGHVPPSPPPNSWASNPSAGVAIWAITMESGAQWTLPAGPSGVNRMLYAFEGQTIWVDGTAVACHTGMLLRPDASVSLRCGDSPAELLLLQARPIGEPVVQHGPFVMNSRAEIQQAFSDYQRTGFGGWPWQQDDPVHSRQSGRFAIHADGRRENID